MKDLYILGEFEFSKGGFIALSPKCYIAKCVSGKVKMGTKGLPQSVNIQFDHFKSCLEKGESFYVNLQSLTRKDNHMSRVAIRKRGISRVFTKFPIENDGVTCGPLKINDTEL